MENWHKYNSNDLVDLMNLYSSIVAKDIYLKNEYNSDDKKEVAQGMLVQIKEMERLIPEDVRSKLKVNPEEIKKKCLEILSTREYKDLFT